MSAKKKFKSFKKEDRVKRIKCKIRLLDLITNDHSEINFIQCQTEGRIQGPEFVVYEELECDQRGIRGKFGSES